MIGATKEVNSDELRRLLDLALAKMSEYATELNSQDNGTRKTYNNIELWKADNASA